MSNSSHELPQKNDTTMTGKQNRTIFSLVLYVILGPGFALYGQVRSDWKHWESLGSLHWAARCSTEKKSLFVPGSPFNLLSQISLKRDAVFLRPLCALKQTALQLSNSVDSFSSL